jgi:hypothetical protein
LQNNPRGLNTHTELRARIEGFSSIPIQHKKGRPTPEKCEKQREKRGDRIEGVII